jgi:hypothetical protein
MSLKNIFNEGNIPKRIFAKKELYNLLLNGDNTVDNTIIVDCQGYLRLIKLDTLDKADLDIIPVRYKTFLAGDRSIGNGREILKSLDEIYKACLQGWLEYLKTKKNVCVESSYYEKSKEELKKEIKEMYSVLKAQNNILK